MKLLCLLSLTFVIAASVLKRDDLSTTVIVRLMCNGKPYDDGRLRLVVGKKQLDEGRSSNGTYTVSSAMYSAPHDNAIVVVRSTFAHRLFTKAGVQIFHTCNRKKCWEQAEEIQIPYDHVSTPESKKKPYDIGRYELDNKFANAKVECIKMD
ncbi:hypothetical protein PFISCL1PPCAC_4552 [Pristionchus fissidentatus]|uniref:Uncharacterized protein n=1 Tax=Pristionchus fissidentatus TaxID=1538716 RepID=A0AAV5V422_9BILA|nr:hypothetical protein PFISCL1PPCAC_4552 [Pristionchus fissidentatus]